jgi:ribosome recycling factor
MYQPRIQVMQKEMERVVNSFTEDLKTLRTGRASVGLIDDLIVSCYGAPTPLKHIASITNPDPKTMVISPWDKSLLTDIESTIRISDLGLNPVNDGTVIRLTIPPLTEERRKELSKRVERMAEEVRVALRTLRRLTWDEIQEMEKGGKISEDDLYAAEKQLNKIIDDFHTAIETLTQAKGKEIMTV